VEAHDTLADRVAVEQDDVLITLQLVRGDRDLEDRLFEQLVDLLVEGLFLDLRRRHESRELDRNGYLVELGTLAAECRAAGLLPFSPLS
jgi:hypothetical protein